MKDSYMYYDISYIKDHISINEPFTHTIDDHNMISIVMIEGNPIRFNIVKTTLNVGFNTDAYYELDSISEMQSYIKEHCSEIPITLCNNLRVACDLFNDYIINKW